MIAREARGRGRPHTWPSLGVALALLALVLAGCGPAARSATTHAPTRTATVSGVIRLGPTDPARVVDITVLLDGQQPQLLAQTLAAIGDPTSPLYRHFLTPAEYAQRFGASPAAEAQVRQALGVAGLAVTGRSPDGLMLHARGRVGQVEALFGVDFADYRGADGKAFYSATAAPHIPAALQGLVSGVLGLDNQTVVKPRRLARAAGGLAGYQPGDINTAYGLSSLETPPQSLDGSGLTVALAEIDTFKQSDIDTYDQQFQLQTQPVDVVNVDGGAEQASDGSETTLDIEVLHAIAPAAHIIAYEGQATLQGMVDIFNQAVTASPAQVVSISLGVCEQFVLHPQQAPQQLQGLFDEPGTTFLAALDTTFKQAGAQGTSVLVSSGDTGAYDCSHLDPANHALSTTLPASNPYVTAVGGTALFLGSGSSYDHEAGWEDPLEEAGGGGGVSQAYQKPLWQTGPGTTTAGSDGMREVPDVAANADPLTGYAVYDSTTAGTQDGCDPQSTGDNSCWTVVGGTSAAAPLWASVTLLADQAAAAAKQGPLGFLNPSLYALAAKAGGSPDFHDVTVGGNLYYQAGPGWDFSTGLGTPAGDTLVPDLVRLGTKSG